MKKEQLTVHRMKRYSRMFGIAEPEVGDLISAAQAQRLKEHKQRITKLSKREE